MHNHPAAVADKHSFPGAIKHCTRLPKTLLIFTLTLQVSPVPQKTEQTGANEKNHHGTEQHPNVAIHPLPARQLLRTIEITGQ